MRKFLLISFILICSKNSYSLPNKNLIPLGDKEAFLGNTGVAVTNSTGSVYFNPANLPSLNKSKFSFSGSHFLKRNAEITPITAIDDSDLNLKATNFDSVPFSIIRVQQFNDWHVGFSILNSANYSVQSRSSMITNGVNPVDLDVLFNISENETLVGLTLAKNHNKEFSWGATLFGEYANYQSNNFTFSRSLSVANTGYATSTTSDYDVYSLFLVLGALYQTPDFDIGFRIETPNLKVKSSGDYFFRLQSNNSGVMTNESEKYQDIEVNKERPTDLSLGIAYKINPQLRTYLDISYQFSVHYNDTNKPDIADETHYKAVVRYNAGTEYQWSDSVSILGGIGYSPNVEGNSEESESIGFTATLGAQIKGKNTQTGVGIFYASSFGDGMVDGEHQTTSFDTYGLMLSSGYNF